MNEKIASLLLIYLVTLSIVYVWSSSALSIDATHSKDVSPSGAIMLTEENHQMHTSVFYVEVQNPSILGDPIDDPKPHGH